MPYYCLLLFLALSLPACGPGTKPIASSRGMSLQQAPAFRCTGTEPFWSIDISESGITFQTPDAGPVTYPFTPPINKGDVIEFFTSLGSGGDQSTLKIILRPGTCSDGMSDTVYPYSVEAALDGRSLRGCAKEKR